MWRRCRSSTSSTRTSSAGRPASARTSSGTRSSMPIPIKDDQTLAELDRYKPLVTYDNAAEVEKIKRHAPHAGLVLRVNVPEHRLHGRAVVQVRRIAGRSRRPHRSRLCRRACPSRACPFTWAASARTFKTMSRPWASPTAFSKKPGSRGHQQVKILDIGGGFPAPYDRARAALRRAGQDPELGIRPAFRPGNRNHRRARPFHGGHRGNAGGGNHRQGRSQRQAVLLRQRRRLRHLLGRALRSLPVPFQRFKKGETEIASVFGPTCDALGRGLGGGGSAGQPAARRFALQRKHRRLHHRERHQLQRHAVAQSCCGRPTGPQKKSKICARTRSRVTYMG